MLINPPSADRVRERLIYNAETGVFTWKRRTDDSVGARRWNPQYAGTVAGGAKRLGYISIRLDGADYGAHRLAWLYVHGVWPSQEIDHINRNTADNRIANLRLADRSQQLANTKRLSRNTSGVRGVSWRADRQCWLARIKVRGDVRILGEFGTKEAAAEAYRAAASEAWGAFAVAA